MRVSGSYVVTGLIGVTGLFGLGFWWFQTLAFYEETWADSVEIAGEVYPVTDFRGIDAASSPLQMRACFLIGEDIRALEALEPEPLVAPGWFKCFSARFIEENLDRGYAKAYVAERDNPRGFDRIIAVFPGGRAYMWRQVSAQIAQ